MTEAETAQELVDKFRPLVTTWDCYNDIPVPEDEIIKDAAKCAVICCEEIIANTTALLNTGLNNDFDLMNNRLEWKQVIEAINKL